MINVVRMKIIILRKLPTALQRTRRPTTYHRCNKALQLILQLMSIPRLLFLQHPRTTRLTSENANENGRITLHHRRHQWESPSGLRGRWTLTKIMMMMARTTRKERYPQANPAPGRPPETARQDLQRALMDVLLMVLVCQMVRRKSSSLLKSVAPLSYDSDVTSQPGMYIMVLKLG